MRALRISRRASSRRPSLLRAQALTTISRATFHGLICHPPALLRTASFASASAGTAFGLTKLVTSIFARPVAESSSMSETFVAGAAGLGLRYRATPALALRLESLASFAGGGHGLTVPTFLGGELWF